MNDTETETYTTISEMCAEFDVTPRTLRFYEYKELLQPRREGQKRLFTKRDKARLKLILRGKRFGFSLDEIGGMFAPDGEPRIDRGRLVEKAEDIDRTIGQLTAMRDGLRHAAECRAPSHMECPTFRRLMRVAARGGLGHSRQKPQSLT